MDCLGGQGGQPVVFGRLVFYILWDSFFKHEWIIWLNLVFFGFKGLGNETKIFELMSVLSAPPYLCHQQQAFGSLWQTCFIFMRFCFNHVAFLVFQNKSTAHLMNWITAHTTWILQGMKSEAQILSCYLFLYWFVHYLWSFTTVYNKYSLVLRCAVPCIILPLFRNIL